VRRQHELDLPGYEYKGNPSDPHGYEGPGCYIVTLNGEDALYGTYGECQLFINRFGGLLRKAVWSRGTWY